jgi:hypothetical protein
MSAEMRGLDWKTDSLKFSAASAPFIIHRETAQIRDYYTGQLQTDMILLKGQKHRLIFEFKFSSEKYPIDDLNVKWLRLDLDRRDTASPTPN